MIGSIKETTGFEGGTTGFKGGTTGSIKETTGTDDSVIIAGVVTSPGIKGETPIRVSLEPETNIGGGVMGEG